VIKAKSAPYLHRGKPAKQKALTNGSDHTIVATYGAIYPGAGEGRCPVPLAGPAVAGLATTMTRAAAMASAVVRRVTVLRFMIDSSGALAWLRGRAGRIGRLWS